ncbi:MAG: response regulator transcription factor [Kiritimatiellae bacterium]|nr:response regulator transcription factor [Kiritimatiellia bacterium]
MADILVADDTRSIRSTLSLLLEEEGHTVRLASDGESALAEYRRKRPDLLLLDVMMPKKNGYQVLKQIRRDDPALPVIILSAKGSPTDVALGLDLGSDDYLPKPFSSEVLLSRINAMFRRMNVMASPEIKPVLKPGFDVASFHVDENRLMLIGADGRETPLSLREVDLLRILTSHPEELMDRDMLFNKIWGYDYGGTTRTLDQYILVLRKKLGDDGACIMTVRGAGYRYQKP